MIPQVPPPDPASDFGIERTARMNIRDSIAGHGMREFMVSDERKAALDADDALAAQHDSKFDADDLMTDALAEDLAKELPTATLLAGKRAALERTIASTRAEMTRQQQIAASALDKFRQLKISMRADEDSLDALPFE